MTVQDLPPEDASPAIVIIWRYSDANGDDRNFRANQFFHIPRPFQTTIAQDYIKIWKKHGRRQANLYLTDMRELFSNKDYTVILEQDKFSEFVENQIQYCQKVISASLTEKMAYSRLSDYLQRRGFTPPAIEKGKTLTGVLKRFQDTKWWKYQARKLYTRQLEEAAIKAGLVHQRKAKYVSDATHKILKKQRLRNQDLLETLHAVNENGQSYTLAELAALSTSNPKNRRCELMARLHGFDVIAKACEHAGLFVTLTCPSRMHPRFKKTGDINSKYDGSTPGQAQEYLCLLWTRIRAQLMHAGIHVYGFRVAEPQHDGTPHWHLLLYTKTENLPKIKALFLHHALQDSPDEKGASDHRCTFKEIDWNKGTGVGYIAKYISKNIDGEHLDSDTDGNSASEAASKVRAWASAHSIRQFQQFGGPTVTSWRELRRIESAPDGVLEQARSAADSGNWSEFTKLFGGTEINRNDQPLKIARQYNDKPGRYGEPLGDQIFGLTDGINTVVTRPHCWEITKGLKSTCMSSAAGLAGGF